MFPDTDINVVKLRGTCFDWCLLCFHFIHTFSLTLNDSEFLLFIQFTVVNYYFVLLLTLRRSGQQYVAVVEQQQVKSLAVDSQLTLCLPRKPFSCVIPLHVCWDRNACISLNTAVQTSCVRACVSLTLYMSKHSNSANLQVTCTRYCS